MISAYLQRNGHARIPVAQAHTLGQSQAMDGGLRRGQAAETNMVPNLGSTSDTHGIPAAYPDDDRAFHDEMLVGLAATKVHANSIKVLRLESEVAGLFKYKHRPALRHLARSSCCFTSIGGAMIGCWSAWLTA